MNPLCKSQASRTTRSLLLARCEVTRATKSRLQKAHIRNAETKFASELQQRDLAMPMAKEDSTGTAETFQRHARAHLEQTAQASRTIIAMADVDRKVNDLEGVLRESMSKAEECSQLLSGYASSVYASDGEALQFPTCHLYPG